MTLRNIAAASLAALALAACGDDDDDNNTKPITPETPTTPEACKAMKCVYQTEGDFKGSFVAKNEKGEPIAVWDTKGTQTHKLGKDGKLHKIEKPDDGKKPGTAGEFDLSGEGVTEPLKEPVRGGSNYLRGSKATFDVEYSLPALSSVGVYGLNESEWDPDLNTFAAAIPNRKVLKGQRTAIFQDIRQFNAVTGKQNAYGRVFPAITTENQIRTKNVSGDDFVGLLSDYSQDLPSTIDMHIDLPGATGVVNALQKNGSLPYGAREHANGTADAAWNQEEGDLRDDPDDIMNGGVPTRLYGTRVWIGNNEPNNITRIRNFSGVENLLPNNPGDPAAKPKAIPTSGPVQNTELPTAVVYDTLNNVQFGRLTGVAEPGSITPIPDGTYKANNLDNVPYPTKIGNGVVNGGVPNATDFYFARGNNPTSLDQMKALNSNILTYHGQALTYGVDNSYHGPQEASGSGTSGLVPNSIGRVGASALTLLGGRGNFVVANFDPAKSVVQGSVYNVWNIATFKPVFDSTTGLITGYEKLRAPQAGENGLQFEGAATATKTFSNVNYKDDHGYKDNLIAFSGSVNGNKIEGDAIRYDDEKGKFAGAFFGPNANEMAGAISSAVKYGKHPKEKWGAVFGAKITSVGGVVPALPGSGKPLGWKLESGERR